LVTALASSSSVPLAVGWRRGSGSACGTSRNALALLLNRPPAQHTDESSALDVRQHIAIASATPLVALASRPDLQAAESRLRAALEARGL
jgi:outer membrane protein TolC